MSSLAQGQARKRILIAEDDPGIRDILSRALGDDYDVTVAQDGNQAIALADSTPPPQLVMLDVMMPGVDGYGVAQRLKMLPALKGVPVIFLTAKDGPLDVIKGIQTGARHYITKPFKITDVVSKVRKALGE